MPKRSTFVHVDLCHVGDFGKNTEKIAKWVKGHGGAVSSEMHEKVTHLVCTKCAWRSKPKLGWSFCSGQEFKRSNTESTVKDAIAQSSCEVVNFEWLEDSLLSKSGRPKPAKPYRWEQPKLIPVKVKKKERAPPQKKETKEKKERGLSLGSPEVW